VSQRQEEEDEHLDPSLMDTLDSLAAQAGGHLEQIYRFRDKLLSSESNFTPPRASTPPVPTNRSEKKSTGLRQNQFNFRWGNHTTPPN